MATLRIKSIGPIIDTGIIELKTVNLFIGKQSTGKSTLLKICSHCRWVEKQLCIGKKRMGKTITYLYTHHYRFIQELIKFYRFDPTFFSANSEIVYVGDTYKIEFKGTPNANAKIDPIKGATPYNARQSFIPSERNLISAIKDIESWYRPKNFDLLFNFLFEWDEVRESYSQANPLPLVVTPHMEFFYDPAKGETIRLTDSKTEISPFYASSGVQSALPLEVMVNALTGVVGTTANMSKSDLVEILNSIMQDGSDMTHMMTESILSKNLMTYQGAVFFIEEIEQNLFPESQANLLRHIVASIKEANQKFEGNHSMVSITTHSPYILSALNVLMAASEAYTIDPNATTAIVPEKYILPYGSISAYYLTPEGTAVDIVDKDIYMVNGVNLDAASQTVEEELDKLNDIICQ
ncbi:MAG: ATP-binding protein [Muribaculaceae bacterium]|nr:ATP-binding protein [Muribaculaceae bacterium]